MQWGLEESYKGWLNITSAEDAERIRLILLVKDS